MEATSSYDIPIIAYHYVEVVTDKRDFLREGLSITPYTFEGQIKLIQQRGYQPIFVKEIPAILSNTANRQNKYIALTFDDGYRDFYTDVFPIIKKYNVKATAYLVPNFLGGSNYMTSQQVQEIVDSGLVEIGAHTLNHAYLTSINPAVADAEISESKKVLEKMFNTKVFSFSYPSGQYNDSVINMVKNAGYTSAVSEDGGQTQTIESLYHLLRIRVGYFNFENELK